MSDDLYGERQPTDTPEDALRWAIGRVRCIAFNIGYLDIPAPGNPVPADLTWQMLDELAEIEYRLVNDFIIRRMVEGERLTPEWTVRPPDDE